MDAAYEGMKKRTFLPMMLVAGTHLPFLVGLIVLGLYKKVRQDNNSIGYSKLDQSD